MAEEWAVGKDSINKEKQLGIDMTAEKRKAEKKDESEPVEKKKFSMNFNSKKTAVNDKVEINLKTNIAPIKMSLSSQRPKKETSISVKPKTAAVAKAFNEEDESDGEEMPPEAKMRMRNIGRDTPTAAGPNSFGKGRLGFCDRQKILERDLKKQIESSEDAEND